MSMEKGHKKVKDEGALKAITKKEKHLSWRIDVLEGTLLGLKES